MKSMPKFRIQRLPPAPNDLHDVDPPLPTGTSSYDPPELTCLREIDHLEPEETVAVVKMSKGRCEAVRLKGLAV